MILFICVFESAKRLFTNSDIVNSISSPLGLNEKLIVFTQPVLLVITCWARGVLIWAHLRKPHTNEVGFVNICMFRVDEGVVTQGILLADEGQRLLFNQLRPWPSASFISIYIDTSEIFILPAKSRLRPFDHGAVLDHPHVTIGPGHQHCCDEEKEPSLQWGQSQRKSRSLRSISFCPSLGPYLIRLVNDNDHSAWSWRNCVKGQQSSSGVFTARINH